MVLDSCLTEIHFLEIKMRAKKRDSSILSLLRASRKSKTFISFKLLHKLSLSLNEAMVLEYILTRFALLSIQVSS